MLVNGNDSIRHYTEINGISTQSNQSSIFTDTDNYLDDG